MRQTLRKAALLLLLVIICLSYAAGQDADPSPTGNCSTLPCLTTYHNNNARAGVNSMETTLSAASFPSLSATTVTLDAMVYAQPLYVSAVPFNAGACTGGSARNMVYVATENNSVYAIDAGTYTICKQVSLNSGDTAIPVPDLPPAPNTTTPCNNITGNSTYGTVGITGTPAIDPGNNVLFVVSAHKSTTGVYTQRLNALDITTLASLSTLDLPSHITGSPTFYAINENQRSGLLVTRNSDSSDNIFVSWGTFCDGNAGTNGSFGLIAEFDWNPTTKAIGTAVETFYPQGAYTNLTSPNSAGPAGIWMSGGAPAADGGGNVYFAVGNGHFEGITSKTLNFGESIVKLGVVPTYSVLDYYTPNVWNVLNNGTNSNVSCSEYPNDHTCVISALPQGDWDLGSGGVVLLTTSSVTSYGELVAAGKEGMFYVTFYCKSSTQCPTTNWNQLMGGLDGLASAGQGGYNTDISSRSQDYSCTPVATAMKPSPGNLAQCFYGVPVQATRAESGERATPAFWSPAGATAYLYAVGTTDALEAYAFSPSSGTFTITTVPSGATTYNYPGATPTISWDGTHTSTAIVWVLETAGYKTGSPAVLSAYAAVPSGTALNQLWTSGTTGPPATKFVVPTVANGKVFVAGGSCTSSTSCAGALTIYHQ